MITFDDGYRDNLSAAKPALERHGFPATVFIVSGYVDSSRDFWWDELLQLWQDSELRELRNYRAVWSDLRSLPHLERQAALDELWERHASRRPNPVTDILTSEDIVALADGGLVEVGAHTVTHPRLAGLPPGRSARGDPFEQTASRADDRTASRELLLPVRRVRPRSPSRRFEQPDFRVRARPVSVQ